LIEVLALLPDNPPAAFIWRRVRRRIVRADGPERIAGEWWRSADEVGTARDYYRVEDEKGARYWLFRDAPADEGGRWFLHGLFA
jgi:protein ImuB